MPNLSRLRRDRRICSTALKLALGGCLLLAGACNNRNAAADKIAQDAQQAQDFDNSLTFNAVTLEEFDKQGRLWWKVKAKQASYSKDKKVARVQEPKGQFFQDGQAVVEVSAQRGEVQQDGQKIFLRGQIVAKDTRDGLMLYGNEMEWQPRTDTLIVRNNVTGKHRRLNLSSKEARFFSRKRQVELEGQVVATATNPALQLKSDRLTWLMQKEIVTSDRPLQVDRFVNKTPVDQAVAERGIVDLKAKLATLNQNARLTMTNPPVQLASNALVWNLNASTVTSDQPVSIVNRQQGVTLTGNQGQMNLKTNLLNLAGNVHGIGERSRSQIHSDRLLWNVTTQQFEAEGNVTYNQASPPLNLTGPKASGALKDQNIVVSGGRVVTEFVP